MSKIDQDEKNSKIYQSMDKFNEQLINTTKDIELNLDKIEKLIEAHTDFVNFVDTMNIYESYRWSNIKFDYNFIKKKINKDKKIIQTIIKLFGSLANYYTPNQIENINNNINEISSNIDLMIYKFSKLQIIHYNFHYKKKHMIKDNSIIKIHSIDDNNKHVLLKLYENYIGIKILDIKLKKLTNMKKYLTHEINMIQTNRDLKN
jgi:hypothetical protein